MEADSEGKNSGEVEYFVLGSVTHPYLLARVRWPDVAQAITAGRRSWLHDLGLFDLPYDPISAAVTATEAATIASDWGTSLPSEGTVIDSSRPLIRRMPANWSRLTPAEKRAWSLEYVPTGLNGIVVDPTADARRAIRRRRFPSLALHRTFGRSKHGTAPASTVVFEGEVKADIATMNANVPDLMRKDIVPAASPERRRHERVRMGGQAQIRCGSKTVSANLVDVSQGGVRWLVSNTEATLEVGEQLGPLLVLRGDGSDSQVSIDMAGTVMWENDTWLGAQFGVAFEQLSDELLDRVQHLLGSSTAELGP